MLFFKGDGLGLNTLEERPEVEPKVRRGIEPSPRISAITLELIRTMIHVTARWSTVCHSTALVRLYRSANT